MGGGLRFWLFMKQVIAVDVWNMILTNNVGRCLSTSGGGLNEHIPVVIIRETNETIDRNDSRPSDSED